MEGLQAPETKAQGFQQSVGPGGGRAVYLPSLVRFCFTVYTVVSSMQSALSSSVKADAGSLQTPAEKARQRKPGGGCLQGGLPPLHEPSNPYGLCDIAQQRDPVLLRTMPCHIARLPRSTPSAIPCGSWACDQPGTCPVQPALPFNPYKTRFPLLHPPRISQNLYTSQSRKDP